MKLLKIGGSLSLALIAFSSVSFAQILLPEVKVVAASYKYLDAVDNKEVAQPVKMLEFKAAAYNVKQHEFYEDDYDTYYVSFYIPDGQILASYDKDGTLLRTAEKFRNTRLPAAVTTAVVTRFPKWIIAQDVYLVDYHEQNGVKKVYKLLLENGDKRLKVKLSENGQFL